MSFGQNDGMDEPQTPAGMVDRGHGVVDAELQFRKFFSRWRSRLGPLGTEELRKPRLQMPGAFIAEISDGAAPKRRKGFDARPREAAEPSIKAVIRIADLDRFLFGGAMGAVMQRERVAVRFQAIARRIEREIGIAGLVAAAVLGFFGLYRFG